MLAALRICALLLSLAESACVGNGDCVSAECGDSPGSARIMDETLLPGAAGERGVTAPEPAGERGVAAPELKERRGDSRGTTERTPSERERGVCGVRGDS